MKVLTVIPGDGKGASMIFARRQMDAVEKTGVVVRRFFLRSRTSPFILISEMRRFRLEIHEFRPDLVHCHFGTMTSFFCACGTLLPLVITFHGSDLNPWPSGNRIRVLVGHVLSQLSAMRAERIICVSNELRQRLWFGKSKAYVVPMGVDTKVFRTMPRSKAREELNWSVDDPVVLFNAGKSPAVKRLDLAEAAFAEARVRIDDLRMEVLKGNTDPDEVPLYLNAADMLLCTSDHEGSPMIIKESIACGLPIVSVPVGDVVERTTGVIPTRIVARDPVALGAAICDVAAMKSRSNGPEKAEAISDVATVDKVLRIYDMITGV